MARFVVVVALQPNPKGLQRCVVNGDARDEEQAIQLAGANVRRNGYQPLDLIRVRQVSV